MRSFEEIKNKLSMLKPTLKDKFKIKEIGIFGSYVRGEQKKRSDLDILVEFEDIPDLFTFIEIEYYLSRKLGVKVDLVMKSSLKKYIGKKILEEVKYL